MITKGKAFPFNNLSEADYLPAAEPRALQKRSICYQQMLLFWRRHPDLNRGNRGFAVRCLTTWLWRRILEKRAFDKTLFSFCGAAYEARTRYLHLGKVALYQMS